MMRRKATAERHMEKAIEIFAAICLSVIALSHILQPRAWVDFFVRLREKGHVGVFAFGLLCLNFGALIVAFHNVWSGWPVIFTIIGWGQVLKGSLYLLAPQFGLRAMGRVAAERAWEFVAGGVVFLAVCSAMWYVVLTR
jgi:hypothetical protein